MSPLRALKMCDISRRFLFADRMSSSTAGADAWLGARWNENMAGSATHDVGSKQQPVSNP
jgi:hypothetical protein